MLIKTGILDNPNKDDRRVHKKPTPRVGGIAMVTSVILSIMIFFVISLFTNIQLDKKLLGYLLGAVIVIAMGFIDDVKTMPALYKFLMQLVAGTIIYIFGIGIVGVKIPFIYTQIIDFGIFAFPITLIWVLGITNAVNLIDGLDGLAAGISSIASISLLFIFAITGAGMETIIITIALVGATIGFLPYNFNPAKTFMGDTGSNFLGYTLATVSIMGMTKGYTVLAIVAPLIVCGVPVFDMVFAIIRRLVKHQKLTTPDKGHIHHRLLRRGFSQRQAVLILYAITSTLGIIAVTMVSGKFKQGIILICSLLLISVVGYLYYDLKHKKGNVLLDERTNIENKTEE